MDAGLLVRFLCVPSATGPEEFLSGPAAGSAVTLTLPSSSWVLLTFWVMLKHRNPFTLWLPAKTRILFNCSTAQTSLILPSQLHYESEPIDRVLLSLWGEPSQGTLFLPAMSEHMSRLPCESLVFLWEHFNSLYFYSHGGRLDSEELVV